MISCRRARALLVENVRQAAPETTLLMLDQHLASCAECRVERARWQTVGSLREWQPPQLGAAARERISRKLLAARPSPPPARRSFAFPALWAAGLSVASVTALVLWLHSPPVRSFSQPGTLQFAEAEVSYRAGTIADLQPKTRTIRLEEGELEVKGRAPLSIRTAHYLVRLTQAHAVFAADSIRVVSGEVYVYSLDEKELAKLSAGQGWPPKAAPPVAPAPVVAPPPPVVAARPTLSSAALLQRARSALADGNAAEARHLIQRALLASPSQPERAEAELFAAESYLVERKSDRALAQYRKVAQSYAHLPQGEAAAFAAAQVLSETGSDEDSHDAFRAYLARYPEGRFSREARDRLKE